MPVESFKIGLLTLQPDDNTLIPLSDISIRSFFRDCIIQKKSIRLKGVPDNDRNNQKKGFTLGFKKKTSNELSDAITVNLNTKESRLSKQWFSLYSNQLKNRNLGLHTHLAVNWLSFIDENDKLYPFLWNPLQIRSIQDDFPFYLDIQNAPIWVNPIKDKLDKKGLALPSLPVKWEISTFDTFWNELQIQIENSDLKIQDHPSIFTFTAQIENSNPDINEVETLELPIGKIYELLPVKTLWHHSPNDIEADLLAVDKGIIVHEETDSKRLLRILCQLAVAECESKKQVIITSKDHALLTALSTNLEPTIASYLLPLFRYTSFVDCAKFIFDNQRNLRKSSKYDLTLPVYISLEQLKEYDEALNTPFKSSEMTPAEMMIALSERDPSLPIVPFELPEIVDITPHQINQWKQFIKQYLKFDQLVDTSSPWFICEVESYDDSLFSALESISRKTESSIKRIVELKERIKTNTGLNVDIFDEQTLHNNIDFLTSAPELDKHQLDQNWNPVPEKVDSLINTLETAKQSVENIKYEFHPEILNENIQSIIDAIKPLIDSPKRFINNAYRTHSKRILGYYKIKGYKFNKSFINKLLRVEEAQIRLKYLYDLKLDAGRYFGNFWKGIDTDLELIKKQTIWLRAFSEFKEKQPMEQLSAVKSFVLSDDTEKINSYLGQINALNKDLNNNKSQLIQLLNLEKPEKIGITQDYNSVITTIQNLMDSKESISVIKTFKKLNSTENASHLKSFISEFKTKINYDTFAPDQVLEYSILNQLIFKVVKERSILSFIEPTDVRIITQAISTKIKTLSEHHYELIGQTQLDRFGTGSEKKLIKKAYDYIKSYAESRDIDFSTEDFWGKVSDFIIRKTPVIITGIKDLSYILNYMDEASVLISIGLKDDELNTILSHSKANKTYIFNSGFEDYVQLITKDSLVYKYSSNSNKDSQIVWSQTKTNAQPGFPSDELLNIAKQHYEASSLACFLFENTHAEIAFIQLYLDNHLDYKPFINKLESQGWQTLYITNKDDFDGRLIDQLLVDFSYKELRSNPFLLKKQTLKAQRDWIRTIIKPVSSKIDFYFIENHKENEIESYEMLLNEELKEIITPLKTKIKNLFKDLTVTVVDKNPAEVLLETKQGVIMVWSDFISQDKGTLLGHYFDLTNISDFSVFNPVLKMVTASNTSYINEIEYILTHGEEIDLKPSVRDKSQKREQGKYLQGQDQDTPFELQIDNVFKEFDIKISVSNFEEVKDQNRAVKPKLNKISRLKPYQAYPISQLGSPEEFFKTSKKNIQKLILEIIEIESPIHWQQLARLIGKAWGMEGINDATLIVVKEHLRSLYNDKKLFIMYGSVFSNQEFKFTLRDRTEIKDDIHKSEIPLSEVEMAIHLVLEQFSPVKKEALFEAAAFTMGLDFDSVLEQRLEKALNKLGVERSISLGKQGYELSNPILLL